MNNQYTFTGVKTFIEAAADAAALDCEFKRRACEGWHAVQAGNTLGNLCETVRAGSHRRGVALQPFVDRVGQIRASLLALLAGIETATLEAVTEYELPCPDWLRDPDPEPEPEPEPEPDLVPALGLTLGTPSRDRRHESRKGRRG